METKETRRVSIGKIIAISAAVALIAFAAMVIAYKLFKKYFKVSFDCGDCDSCDAGCFDDDFDLFMEDEDYEPSCSLCDDEDEDEVIAPAEDAE